MQQLLDSELPKDTQMLTDLQKEQLMTDKGKLFIKQKLEEFPHLSQIAGGKNDVKEHDESKHPLLKAITEQTSFYLVRLPNRDCLNFGLMQKQ